MRSSKNRSSDVSQLARSIVEKATGELLTPKKKNPAAVSLGRLGGLKGGKARAIKLKKSRRIEIARMAAKARWGRDNAE